MAKKYAIRFKDGEAWECRTLTEAEEYAERNEGAEVFSGKAAEIVIANGLRKQLAKYGVKPGAEVRTILTHVSRSGMSRRIKLVTAYKGEEGPQIMDITRMVAKLCGYKLSQSDGALIVNGCGMDMGFAVVYDLGSAMWPKGTKKPHGTRNGEPDSTGGYALKQRWL